MWNNFQNNSVSNSSSVKVEDVKTSPKAVIAKVTWITKQPFSTLEKTKVKIHRRKLSHEDTKLIFYKLSCQEIVYCKDMKLGSYLSALYARKNWNGKVFNSLIAVLFPPVAYSGVAICNGHSLELINGKS
ncbi:unnamed protein product [Natator depressus]